MLKPPITIQGDRIFISGELTFATVPAVWELSLKLFPEKGAWCCDFSQVTACDSAALALLLEWLKLAKKKAKLLQFLDLPSQLRSLATPAGLNELLDEKP
jgi:phospholipid transport system transporter-binding protein